MRVYVIFDMDSHDMARDQDLMHGVKSARDACRSVRPVAVNGIAA